MGTILEINLEFYCKDCRKPIEIERGSLWWHIGVTPCRDCRRDAIDEAFRLAKKEEPHGQNA